MPPTSLLIDGTSPTHTKVSLWQDQSLLTQTITTNEVPARIIESILTTQQLHLHDLTFLAWIQGPGSYTGLRVSAATLKALSLMFPIISVNIFEISVTMCQSPSSILLIPIIQARKNEYFLQVFLYKEERYHPLSHHTLLGAYELSHLYETYTNRYPIPIYFLPIQLADTITMDKSPFENMPSKAIISWDTDYMNCIQSAQKCVLAAYEKKIFTPEEAIIPLYFKPPYLTKSKN